MARTSRTGIAHGSAQTRWLAALGLLFIAGSFAMLLRESFSDRRAAAEIAIQVRDISPSAQGYLVRVTAVNRGNAAAASLVVEGVLTRDGGNPETSLITIDHLAPGSERAAALFFSSDPRQGALVVRPKGYIEP